MFRTVLATLQPHLDPHCRISILCSSEDPDLYEYFEFFGLPGSTDMSDADGTICVKLHDKNGVDKLTWLEEFAHALQYIKDGNIPFSCDHQVRNEREVEASSCILKNAARLRLTPDERKDCERRIRHYGSKLCR